MTVTKMSQFYFESYQSTSIRTIVPYLYSHYSTRPLICTVYNFTKFDIIFLAILPILVSFQKVFYSSGVCQLKFPSVLLSRIVILATPNYSALPLYIDSHGLHHAEFHTTSPIIQKLKTFPYHPFNIRKVLTKITQSIHHLTV